MESSSRTGTDHSDSPRPTIRPIAALALSVFVIIAWGLNWTVTRYVVGELPPFWTAALRTAIAVAALAALLIARRQMIIPKRGDVGIIIAIGFFHMTAFSALMTVGLKYLPVGRSIVLAYTTPIWVFPLAYAFLGERITPRRVSGLVLALAGVFVLLNPLAFDWSDQNQLWGCFLLLLSALAWSISIVYTRAHRWISTPFQLVFWETLLALICLLALACLLENKPNLAMSQGAIGGLLFSGIIGTAFAYWAMTIVNRSLPATATSLLMLGTPFVGILTANWLLQEPIEIWVLLSGAMVVIGIAVGGTGNTESSSDGRGPHREGI